MNTTKQVNVMVGLLFMAILVFGTYIATEGAREASARAEQDELLARRGADLFVANCRSCHGLDGLGQDEGGVGPKLNTVAFLVLGRDNSFGLQETPAGDARNIHDFLFSTIACGRSNTAMPLWSERYGGPLSEAQVNQLVTMITQARWDLVQQVGEEHDAPLRAQHAEAIAKFSRPYDDPTLAADKNLSREQKKAVDDAIAAGTAKQYEDLTADQRKAVDAALSKSVLAPDPTKLAVTSKNCGQYGASVLEFRERNPLTGPAAASGAAPAPAGGAAGGGDAVKLGQQVATQFGCVACHSIDGKAGVGPTWKGLADHDVELASGGTVKADDAYLKESITNTNAKVVKGFQANVMPATFGTQLKPEQIDQIVAYIKSLK